MTSASDLVVLVEAVVVEVDMFSTVRKGSCEAAKKCVAKKKLS